jgi:hypothetical protein
MVLQCARCIAVHGAPGCVATHETEAGEPSCTWHLDGELCPIEQKQQRAARKKNPGTPPAAGESEKPANEQKSGVTTMKTPETDPISTPKTICARPGCTVELSGRNASGCCRAHARWRDRTSSAGNGHAAAGSNGAPRAAHAAGNGARAAANGSAKKNGSNGHAATPAGSNGAAEGLPELAADRVDQLLATLTAGDKARLALAWLRGTL